MKKNYIYGKNSVLEFLKSNQDFKKIYLNQNIKLNFKIKQKQVFLSKKELDQIIEQNHQGYIIELKEFIYYDLNVIFKEKANNVLILDHIEDPQNFGSIIRNAVAFDFFHIIIPKKRAAKINSTVIKVASGSYHHVKIICVNSLVATINILKKHYFWIYASCLHHQSSQLQNLKFNVKKVIIFGNENKGISRTLLKLSDKKFYIKMSSKIQSLNVAIATGITLFKIKNN